MNKRGFFSALAVATAAFTLASGAGLVQAAPVVPGTVTDSSGEVHGMGFDIAAARAHHAKTGNERASFESSPAIAAPDSYSLKDYALSPGDQGQVGSCVTWATGYSGYGILMNEAGRSGAPMAPMFIYSQIVKENNNGQDSGTFASVALPMEKSRGIDTQWLVLEGTRMIDERSRDRGAVPAPSESAANSTAETSFAGIEDEAVTASRALILVDDDPLFREMACDYLGRQGFRVVICETGTACLAAVDREAGSGVPPAVAADIVMPTMDNQGFLGGLELLEKLRRAHPEVPVVAVTAYPDENVKARVLELGGQFLLKPGAGEAGGADSFFANLAALLGEASAVGNPPPAAVATPPPAPASEASAPPRCPGACASSRTPAQ